MAAKPLFWHDIEDWPYDSSRRKLGSVMPGPMDVVLSPTLVFQPDGLFIRADRRGILLESRVGGPPDLGVEVVSEANRTHDTRVKLQEYARHGAAEYWLVDPREGEISSWRNADGQFELVGRARKGEGVASLVLPELDLDAERMLPGAAER